MNGPALVDVLCWRSCGFQAFAVVAVSLGSGGAVKAKRPSFQLLVTQGVVSAGASSAARPTTKRLITGSEATRLNTGQCLPT